MTNRSQNSSANSDNEAASTKKGVIAGLIAFSTWGFFPLYWKTLIHVPAFEILIHRIFWAAIFAAVILAIRKTLISTVADALHGRSLKLFLASSLLIGGNWFLYIWSVNSGQVLESSFGYFINPLMSIALGRFFLGEKFNRNQKIALAFATLGVLAMTWSYGRLPWIALVLAGSFALYGLVRKKAPAGAVRGLFIESALLAPFALGYGIWLWLHGEASFLATTAVSNSLLAFGLNSTDLLLIGAGIATGIPLLAFGAAVTRLPLSSIGFMQYIAPSCQFLLAVFVFHEAFDSTKLMSFGLIWIGLGVYSLDLALRTIQRKVRKGL